MRIGDVLDGKYRLVRRLGEGGEGTVYLALHLQTEQFWAVKEIRMEHAADRCHELEMMKNLKNEHLPGIIDVVRREDSVCLVMEHVRGKSLERFLAEGYTASSQQTADAALQVAEALCYLETRDPPVCHLDIKPSNLIRSPDGKIKLVDFGAAWKDRTVLRPVGTEGYAAPEQYAAAGSGGADSPGRTGPGVDARTDLYALGATLYRMISGKKYSPSLHKSCVPNCPAELSDIILRCLEPDPDSRFRNARQLRDALRSMLRARRRRRRRIQVLGALAMALPAAAFCVSVIPESMNLSADERWDYDSLLQEAEVSGEAESMSLCRRAIFLDPGRKDAWLQFLDLARADSVFSGGEETFLRDTLHTVEAGSDLTAGERLRTDPDAYGETALQIGLTYWYCGVEEDSRRIAAGWFRRAVQAAREKAARGKAVQVYAAREETGQGNGPVHEEGERKGSDPDAGEDRTWEEQAVWYQELSAARMVLEGKPDSGSAPLEAAKYWKSLGALMQDGYQENDPVMRVKFCSEALSAIAFLTGDLKAAGIAEPQLRGRILELIRAARTVRGTEAQAAILEEVKNEAELAAGAALQAVENLRNTRR